MIIKCLIKNVNTCTKQEEWVKNLQVLSQVLQRANLKEFKLDVFQKIIEKIKFILKTTENPDWAEILSFSHERMLNSFFAKKQLELKRQGLSEGYRKLVWSDVRNYSPLTNDGEKQLNDCKIPDQIIVTPFTISQDFNIL